MVFSGHILWTKVDSFCQVENPVIHEVSVPKGKLCLLEVLDIHTKGADTSNATSHVNYPNIKMALCIFHSFRARHAIKNGSNLTIY